MRKVKACTLNNPKHFAKHAPKSFKALELIQAHSSLGKRLYDWAEKTNLVFKEKPMPSLGLGGPSVTCHSDNSISTNIGIIAHELMHCVQFQVHGNKSYDYKQDARSRIINGRGLEAGAVACQLRILYEMKLNNYPKAWDDVMKNQAMFKTVKGEWVRAHGAYAQIGEHFETAFKQAVKSGKASNEAMKDACTAAHHAYFQSQGLRDAYNKIYLKQYIKNLIDGSLGKHIPEPEIDIKTLRSMTKISENDFLTHDDIRIPLDDEGLFGNNDLMRQAFDYVEATRIVYRKGDSNYGSMKVMKQLSEDKNPYLGIKLKDVIDTLNVQGEIRDILEIMNDMAGIGNQQQLSLDFHDVANNNTPRTQRQANKLKRRALNKKKF